MSLEKRPKSIERAGVFLKAAFEALRDAGGSLSLRDVKAAVAKKVVLSEHDLERYEKTGYVRWESVLHFYSIDCAKAGFIQKNSGLWHLTESGRKVVDLPPDQIVELANKGYVEWKAGQPRLRTH